MFNSCYGTGGNFMRPSLSMVQDKPVPGTETSGCLAVRC